MLCLILLFYNQIVVIVQLIDIKWGKAVLIFLMPINIIRSSSKEDEYKARKV